MSTSPVHTGGVTDNRTSIPPPHPHPHGHSDVPISSHASLSTASKLAVLRVAKAKAKTNQSFNEQGQGNKRFHISFHLRPQDKAIPVSSAAFKKLVHDEYLCKYLESLGVTPSRATLEKARIQLPQDELKVAAAWKSDTVTVSPLERSAVLHNNRLQMLATKQRVKESRAEATARKMEREREKEEEEKRRGGGGGGGTVRRRDRSEQKEKEKDKSNIERNKPLPDDTSLPIGSPSSSDSAAAVIDATPAPAATVTSSGTANSRPTSASPLATIGTNQPSVNATASSSSSAAARPSPPTSRRHRTNGTTHSSTTANASSSPSSSSAPIGVSSAPPPPRSRSRSTRSTGVGVRPSASSTMVGGIVVTDIISSVLVRQESIFDTMRSVLDQKRRIGDERDEEIDEFWKAARSKHIPTTATAAESNTNSNSNSAINSADGSNSSDPSHLASSPSISPKNNTAAAGGGGGGGGATPAPTSTSSTESQHQLLQVFTLYHFLHAHAFSNQTRRHKIMSQEESSIIAGENMFMTTTTSKKKKKSPAANSGAATTTTTTTSSNNGTSTAGGDSSSRSNSPMAQRHHPVRSYASAAPRSSPHDYQQLLQLPDVPILYWRPSVEDMTPTATTTNTTSHDVSNASIRRHSASVLPSSFSFPSSYSSPLTSTFYGFSSSSRSYGALNELFTKPFACDPTGDVAQAVKLFLKLFPKYRTGIFEASLRHERRYEHATPATAVTLATSANGNFAAHHRPNHATIAPTSLASSVVHSNSMPPPPPPSLAFDHWHPACHNSFGLVSSSDGTQLTLSIGAAASIAAAASANSGSSPSTSMMAIAQMAANQPSKLQAFYNEDEFRRLLHQANSVLNQSHVHNLIGLVGHYLYWTMFAPQLDLMRRYTVYEMEQERLNPSSPSAGAAPTSTLGAGTSTKSNSKSGSTSLPIAMSSEELTSLLLTLQRMFLELDHQLRKLHHYSLFFLPLLMDLLCTSLLNLFHSRTLSSRRMARPPDDSGDGKTSLIRVEVRKKRLRSLTELELIPVEDKAAAVATVEDGAAVSDVDSDMNIGTAELLLCV